MTPCVEHSQKGRYARVSRGGRLRALHVVVWEDANGPKPAGWDVDHLCHNCRCINLEHLEAVPAIVNQRRKRTVRLSMEVARQIRAEYAALPRATRHPRRKLKTSRPPKVVAGARAALREKYGLRHEHFRDLIEGKIWAE